MISKSYFTNFKYFFLIYLVFLFIVSFFQLYEKHTGGADSTISEWLINYQGGFIKRGIIGEIAFNLANILGQELRYIIYLFQVLLVFFYFLIIYIFLYQLKINYYYLFIIFSPIFILYPVAEVEVLARKEIFIFIGYIIFLYLCSNNKNKYDVAFIIFFLPILSLIWEPVIFFSPFFVAPLLLKYSIKIFKKLIFLTLSFIPFLILSIFIALNPISEENHLKMANSLMDNFGENCYMSCALLLSKSKLIDQFTYNFPKYSLEIFVRYFVIILIGFGPIFIISKNSYLKKNIIFFNKFKNLLFPFIILGSPMILLFSMGSDWGRWVNITYTFNALFFIYLLKYKHIIVELDSLDILFKKFKNYQLVILFVIICFSWNPKTSLTGDVASFPGYRIPYNFFKLLLNF